MLLKIIPLPDPPSSGTNGCSLANISILWCSCMWKTVLSLGAHTESFEVSGPDECRKNHTLTSDMRGRGKGWQWLSLQHFQNSKSKTRNIVNCSSDWFGEKLELLYFLICFAYKMWANFKAPNRKTVTDILADALRLFSRWWWRMARVGHEEISIKVFSLKHNNKNKKISQAYQLSFQSCLLMKLPWLRLDFGFNPTEKCCHLGIDSWLVL